MIRNMWVWIGLRWSKGQGVFFCLSAYTYITIARDLVGRTCMKGTANIFSGIFLLSFHLQVCRSQVVSPSAVLADNHRRLADSDHLACPVLTPRHPLPQEFVVLAMSVHPVAESGFSSGASNYDSARPDHQVPAVNHLLEKLAVPHGGTIVEIGSGTGKFTGHLLNRPEQWKVICIEPSEVNVSIPELT